MTLDTKALEAAAIRILPAIFTLPPGHGWNELDEPRKNAVLEIVRQSVGTYNATRSQSLPDELKAIGERIERRNLGTYYAVNHIGEMAKAADADCATLLSHIQDIRRDTAREIVKAIEKDAEADLSAAEQCQGPEVSRRMYAVSRRLRGLAASIRTAYGVEG